MGLHEYGLSLIRLGKILMDGESSLSDVVEAAMDCGLELQFRLVASQPVDDDPEEILP